MSELDTTLAIERAPHDADDLYRIGTVAKLTGISVERLRAWERRYAMLPARREGRTRFYSRDQVERLKKMHALIERGHPISSLVDLTSEQLDARLTSRTTEATTSQVATVGLVGPNLLVMEQQQNEAPRVATAARWANLDAFAEDPLDTTPELDALVVQIPVLALETIEFIGKKLPSARLVLLYQFATAAQIEAAQTAGHPTIRWPATWLEIEQACALTTGAPLRAARSAPSRFTDEELIAIASTSQDTSGLPQHLVDLITQLNAFCEFALDCADQSTLQASDAPSARLYEQLHNDTTHARAQLELALEAFVQSDALLERPN